MDADALRVMFRKILVGALASSPMVLAIGCGASVNPNVPGDASGDRVTIDPDVVIDRDADRDGGACAPLTTGAPCSRTIVYPCGVPAELLTDAGTFDYQACDSLCAAPGMPSFGCSFQASTGSGDQVFCYMCGVGRRTEGLELERTHTTDVLRDYLCDAATFEAASVTAFERMRDELRAWGAPASVLCALEQAAREEADHAERVGAMAAKHGGTPRAPTVHPIAPRTIESVAMENAVEGCVRETYGALVLEWQAARARDAELASLFARLAQDESRHAALSWHVHPWLRAKLDADGRARVDRAAREAVRALRDEMEHTPHSALIEQAGLPTPREARALLDALDAQLFSRAMEHGPYTA